MRETQKVLTKGGHEVEVYTYVTGGEARAITGVYLEGIKIAVDEAGRAKADSVDPTLASKAQDKAIESLVVSVDGEKNEILRRVLDLPNADFMEVMAALDALQGGLTAEKKTS